MTVLSVRRIRTKKSNYRQKIAIEMLREREFTRYHFKWNVNGKNLSAFELKFRKLPTEKCIINGILVWIKPKMHNTTPYRTSHNLWLLRRAQYGIWNVPLQRTKGWTVSWCYVQNTVQKNSNERKQKQIHFKAYEIGLCILTALHTTCKYFMLTSITFDWLFFFSLVYLFRSHFS